VVDDDADITQLLAQYWSRFGFTAHTARDGDTLRRVLATQPVDRVVLNVMLPSTDGLAFARHLIMPNRRAPLSKAEFWLLCTFLSMPWRICSRERGLEDAHGRSMVAYERSIDRLCCACPGAGRRHPEWAENQGTGVRAQGSGWRRSACI